MRTPLQSRRIFLGLLAAGLLAGLLVVGFLGSPQSSAATEEPFNLFSIPGTLEGTGTHFAIIDSEYLNITLDSSEEIELRMKSTPEMITMSIEPDDSVTTTRIRITGLNPETTYYKFEDSYRNAVAFVTDSNGTYGYTQNISNRHFVFIQPRMSTKFILDNATGGDCSTIGIWNSNTKTCTLTNDLNESIEVVDGITLDGNGHTLSPEFQRGGIGVLVSGRTGVTVENLTVRNFTTGILFFFSNNSIATGNRIEDNGFEGIWFEFSTGNVLSNNIALNNGFGISLTGVIGANIMRGNVLQDNRFLDVQFSTTTEQLCSDNDIRDNIGSGGRPIRYVNSQVTLENQTFSELILCNADGSTINNVTIEGSATERNNGIFLSHTSSVTMTSTTSSDNLFGITLFRSDNNVLADNTFSFNGIHGIALGGSNNTVTRNTISSNGFDGFGIGNGVSIGGNNNTVTRNTISSNGFIGVSIGGRFASNNTVARNTISSNGSVGVSIFASNDNRVFQNNFIDNPTQARDARGTNNIFNLAKPVGGNFWSNYDTPAEGCNDRNSDGFCDVPFVFTGFGRDNFPWTVRDGWLGPQRVNVELSWSANEDPDFESYRIFRDTVREVDLTAEPIKTVSDASQTTHIDENLDTGQAFFYQVVVFDQAGLSTGSDVEEVETTLP